MHDTTKTEKTKPAFIPSLLCEKICSAAEQFKDDGIKHKFTLAIVFARDIWTISESIS